MISANDLRNVQLHHDAEGYSRDEVTSVIEQAADTIEAYANENKELYRKLELLAAKIEEYRSEEDSIKTALITAQKMADKIETESKEKAKAVTDEAEMNAEKAVSEARAYAAGLIQDKTAEANTIIADAEKKANEAISSSKIVAQDILNQAKEISEDMISSSREEKEAYTLLNEALKKDAAEFIEKLKALYTEQLDALNAAKLDADATASAAEVERLEQDRESLIAEIDEMEEAIPEAVTVTPDEPENTEAPAEEEPEPEVAAEEAPEEVQLTLTEENPEAAREAVEAFSSDTLTPIEPQNTLEEITEEAEMEEKSLFDEEQPFESYFNVSKKDAHFDKTQTISLVPPEDFDAGEDGEDGAKHKGLFRKKR